MRYFQTSTQAREAFPDLTEDQLTQTWRDADETIGQMSGYYIPDDEGEPSELPTPDHASATIEEHAEKHGPDYLSLAEILKKNDAVAAMAIMTGQHDVLRQRVEQYTPFNDIGCIVETRAYGHLSSVAQASQGSITGEDVMALIAGALMDGFLLGAQFVTDKADASKKLSVGQYL